MSTKTELRQASFRRLTKGEIDRQIYTLVEGLALDSCEPLGGESSLPRWIAASELINRMRPFIVLN